MEHVDEEGVWITDEQFRLADYYGAYVFSDGHGGIYAAFSGRPEIKFSLLTPISELRAMLRAAVGVDVARELMVSVCVA